METPIPYNKDITYFAKTNFRNHSQVFGIKRKDRRQHMYVLGKSGTGKSVLLSNLIAQNIQNGDGLCVVDPHGELVEEVLDLIPPHRVDDVIYFNPADSDFHIGFNVIQLDDPKYKHLVASGLMGIFTKIWANAWSSRMEYILNNAILALLDTPGTTLLGIPRILVDKDYRQMIIGNLKDPVVKAFWVHEYEQWRDQFRNEAIAPIQNKVGQFLSTSIIRNVVGQPKSTINIFDIMNEGKIFLVNVSKGRVGEDNSALLGGMIITKIQLAAMERVRIPEQERRDFYLYVDEFQNFATDAFANILSEARKYRLNLIIAHQYTAQLETKESTAVRDAVFGNVGTMIIFRVGADDAEFLEKEFEPEFMAQDLVNLPNYHVYLKLMIDGITSRPFSATTLPPIKIDAEANVKEKIIESSRRLYTRSREEVEDEINNWSGMLQATDGSISKFKVECSNCKKEISVPFEPTPGKPVYCKECLAKIKDGVVTPERGFIAPKAFKQEQENSAPLAALGIQFTSDSIKGIPPKHFSKMQSTSSIPTKTTGFVKSPTSSTPYTQPKNNFQPKPFDKKKSGPSPLLKGLLQKIGVDVAPNVQDIKDLPIKEVKKDTPPPMSLDSLKKPDSKIPDPAPKIVIPAIPTKEASAEKMNELKNIFAKVTVAPKQDISPIDPIPAPPPVTPLAPTPTPVVPLQEEPINTQAKSDDTKSTWEKNQNPKEVPEDVLKKVLE
jgi:CxxC-x17-CxxC domain-containing protein